MPLAFDFHLSRDCRVFYPLLLFFCRISNDLHKILNLKMQQGHKWDKTEKEEKRKSDENQTKLGQNWDKTETKLRKVRQNCNELQINGDIETNQNKLHVISLWWLCITFVWPRGSKKVQTTALSTDQNAIWRYFTLFRLCLALVFFVSIIVAFELELLDHC